MRNQDALARYVETLPLESREWVIALYVDDALNLLSVETIGRGTVHSAPINIGRVICRGRAIEATGFFLVHNHPSGDPKPSPADVAVTKRLQQAADACGLTMLSHLVVAKNGMRTVGNW